MPFGLEPTAGPSRLSKQALAVPDVLGDLAVDTFRSNPLMSIGNIIRRGEALRGQSERVSEALALEKTAGLGIPVPKNGFKEAELELLINEAKRRKILNSRLQAVPDSSAKTAAVLTTGFAVSMLDPINIASSFIPVVGQARYASMLSRASSTAGRAAVRARVGLAEGAVGAAVVEPIVLAGQSAVDADYTMLDSLLNIAIGSALGATLHSGIGWISDKVSGTPANTVANALNETSAEVREAAARVAIARAAEGKDPNIETILGTDAAFARTASDGKKGVVSDSLKNRRDTVSSLIKVLDRKIVQLKPQAAEGPTIADRKALKAELAGLQADFGKIEAQIRAVKGKGAKRKKQELQQQRAESGIAERIEALKEAVRDAESKPKDRSQAQLTKAQQEKAALETELRNIDRAQRRIDRNKTPDLEGINVDAQAVESEVTFAREAFNRRNIEKAKTAANAPDRSMLYDAKAVERSEVDFENAFVETDFEAAKAEVDELMESTRAMAELAGLSDELNLFMEPFAEIQKQLNTTQKIAEVAAICRVSNG